MLDSEVCGQVVCQVVGVGTWVGGTHGADHLLEGRAVAVLLGHVLTEQGLGQPNLATEGAGVGLGLVHAVALSAVEQLCTGGVWVGG